MLKSIELQGFKSFAKKNELVFNTPVTAIVGPNGSGKSNVVEAIRFVMGEQSMKSLRGKSSSDLIFKGSKNLAQLNRAKVTIVFDNKDKKFTFSDDSALSVDFESLELSREVFKDGGSVYAINKTEARLKDVNDLLASVNIGSSGHHIISQGEADRLLSASIKERREMIEDALGLKAFQYRLKDAERRLEKSNENLKEVDIQRREIAPHIKFLRKQVEKTQQAEEAKQELYEIYKKYLSVEYGYIASEKARLSKVESELSSRLLDTREKLRLYEEKEGDTRSSSVYSEEVQRIEQKLGNIRGDMDSILKDETRLRTFTEIEKQNLDKFSREENESVTISSRKIKIFLGEIGTIFDDIRDNQDISYIKGRIQQLKERVEQEFSKYKDGNTFGDKDQKIFESKDRITELSKEIEELLKKKLALQAQEERFRLERQEILQAEKQKQSSDLEKEREKSDIKIRKQELEGQISLISREIGEITHREQLFEEEIREGAVLLSSRVLDYRNEPAPEGEVDQTAQAHLRREVEKLKIKIESLGGAGGEDLKKEYEMTVERDQFLERESEDILKAKADIELIIKDTKVTIEDRFITGVSSINKSFQDYFETMFGGGKAYLELVAEKKKKKRNIEEDEDEIVVDEDDSEVEKGIDIHVSLPHKKVKELMMLSGGERSLTSIALLFAISSVNPPPFIVLDETDAALDEANSKRYGDMIERLSEKSQLIVVTHNRETMSRAQMIYGITIGSDGSSRMLNIKFDEAVKVAK